MSEFSILAGHEKALKNISFSGQLKMGLAANQEFVSELKKLLNTAFS